MIICANSVLLQARTFYKLQQLLRCLTSGTSYACGAFHNRDRCSTVTICSCNRSFAGLTAPGALVRNEALNKGIDVKKQFLSTKNHLAVCGGEGETNRFLNLWPARACCTR